MRIPPLLLAPFLVASSTNAYVAAIPVEELGSATRSKDGFYISVSTGIAPADSRERGGMPSVGLSVQVPLRVGQTLLGLVFLEIQGDKGQETLSVLLDGRKHGNEMWYNVSGTRHLMQNCVVHFEYKARPHDEQMVKDYVVRLKHHTPTQSDVDKINRQLRN